MADLALGAVHSLLGLIRDETALLGRVQGDVQFIKDEMESMNSFLLHLARTTPPSGEHDEQVRTWMKQVRDLANDCTNCIDLYVQRRDPELQRARGLMGYVMWLPWFLRALVAQHRAAVQLQELKIRAHDVGNRRMRYGVKVPKGQGGDGEAGLGASPVGLVAGEEEHGRPDLLKNLGSALAFSDPVLEKCTKDLLRRIANASTMKEEGQGHRVIAVAAPDMEIARDIAQQVCHRLPSFLPPRLQFERQAWLTLPNTKNAYFLCWHLLTAFLGELLHPGHPIRNDEEESWNKMTDEGLARKIAGHLGVEGKRSLIILVGFDHEHLWEEMNHALCAFGCAAGSMVIVTTNYERVAQELMKRYKEKPVVYTRAQFFYQRALEVVYGPNHNITDYYFEEKGPPMRQILHDIFNNCEPHVFCMKLFFHSLCAIANPYKCKQELERLCNVLHPHDSLETKASKMLLFCYNNMPKETKSCLMYLAIFEQGHEVRRSRLVERWVAEGLVTGEDWPSSVHQAERCFDALVDRWFIAPGPDGISTTGKVKTCVLQHNLVYKFVREIARKERFVDSRLSHHLAWHFSIHNGLWLRRSDTIEGFLRKLPPSSQLHQVKVLDLKGCKDLEKNKHKYLKNICNKMLLLKYLSLRQTDITLLPVEINKLQQLEVLDIQETKVDPYATRDILLPKLKRLLAGGGSNRFDGTFTDAVKTPLKIDKMPYIEVLSHVEFSSSRDASNVKTIARLWLLKKLGVVIYNKQSHVTSMLGAISDMNECLQSLSIRIKYEKGAENTEAPDYTNSIMNIPDHFKDVFKKPPKYLKSLSINGVSGGTGLLLQILLFKCSDQVAKVTLSNTFMKQKDVETFLAKVSKLRCLRLRFKSYIGRILSLKDGEFQNLEYLLVDDPDITGLSFDVTAAPKLEKITWSRTNIESLSGIHNLRALKELEFNSCIIPDQVREDIATHPNFPDVKIN